MTKRNKVLIFAICALAVLCFGLYYWLSNSGTTDTLSREEQNGLEATEAWARLAPLPDSASELKITTEGNMFTRGFNVSFYLSEADLTAWIAASPGFQDAEVTTDGTIKEYEIEPGEGAQYAHAIIDFNSGYVQIHTNWS